MRWAVLTVLLLAACVPKQQKTAWRDMKPTGVDRSTEVLNADAANCRFIINAAQPTRVHVLDLFADCMQGKGWREEVVS